jgi:hypothetical protein
MIWTSDDPHGFSPGTINMQSESAVRCDRRHSFGGDLKAMFDQLWGQLIMPTDLGAVVDRKREVRAEAQTDITFVLVFLIICLVMLVLLFADQSFARANIEWMCLF